jgi:hypothetical protein
MAATAVGAVVLAGPVLRHQLQLVAQVCRRQLLVRLLLGVAVAVAVVPVRLLRLPVVAQVVRAQTAETVPLTLVAAVVVEVALPLDITAAQVEAE